MSKQSKILYKVILCALFSALSFVGCYIHIPMPTGGFVHLGNFFCILAALLCGGVIGGISGSVGMGLFDWFIYYGHFGAGTLRTILLKLIMGLIVGFVFRFLVKKNVNTKPWNYSLTAAFTVLFGLSLYGSIAGPFTIGTKSVGIHWIVPVFFAVIVVLYVLVLIFGGRMKKLTYVALTAISLGTVFNIFGEVFIKALLYYWLESKYETYDAAFIYSVTSLPGVAITSALTCILGALFYYPVYRATRNLNRLSFIELERLEDEEESKEEPIAAKENA